LASSSLAGLPTRVLAACLGWLAVAGVLELLSIFGFVAVFKLVFGGRMSWRQSWPVGLRGLAASTVLPAGGLIGPAAAARSALPHHGSLGVTTRSAIAFLILTTAPGVVVLAGLGLLVWAGGAAGPHKAVLTLVPAMLATAAMAGPWLLRGHFTESETRVRPIRGGIAEAHRLLRSPSWELAGAVAYYAFDNAALWATFHAYGRTPPVSIIVMGYLVGAGGAGSGGRRNDRGARPVWGARGAGRRRGAALPRGVALPTGCPGSLRLA
jgi:uncharacterized membrane protein YbhN (UPF0104 family)